MQALRRIAAVAAIILVGAAIGKAPLAADALKQQQGPSIRLAAGEESPFGGPPPPKFRGKTGSMCKTPAGTCKLDRPRPLGSPCSCPGSDGAPVKGKVVE